MSEKEKIVEVSVQKKGVFNFEELYKFCTKWVEDRNYIIFEERNEEDKKDTIEKLIKWTSEKEITDYFKYQLKVKFTTDMKNVKTEDGEKVNKGEVKVKVKGLLVHDWQDEWEDKPVRKFLRGMYDKFFIKKRVDKYREKLKKDVEELANQVRGFLGLNKR